MMSETLIYHNACISLASVKKPRERMHGTNSNFKPWMLILGRTSPSWACRLGSPTTTNWLPLLTPSWSSPWVSGRASQLRDSPSYSTVSLGGIWGSRQAPPFSTLRRSSPSATTFRSVKNESMYHARRISKQTEFRFLTPIHSSAPLLYFAHITTYTKTSKKPSRWCSGKMKLGAFWNP